MLKIAPISFKEANEFVLKYHRHHKPVRWWKFGLSVVDEDKLHGVCIVNRPVNRFLDDGKTLEVSRLCTDGTPNACSILYAAAWRVARDLGYERIVTYILCTESGTSLKAAGWNFIHITKGRSWNHPSRPRTDKHPLCDKQMWERNIDAKAAQCKNTSIAYKTEKSLFEY